MRRHAALSGPLCPADPSHGPLLSWAGTSGYWCPHSAHSLPARRGDSMPETVRWFTQAEVEAAQSSQLQAWA